MTSTHEPKTQAQAPDFPNPKTQGQAPLFLNPKTGQASNSAFGGGAAPVKATADFDTGPAHSTLVGGSTAARLMACPASFTMLQKAAPLLPEPTTNIYAEIGTAEHEAAARCIVEQCDPLELLGCVFNGISLSHEHIADLQPIIAFTDRLLAQETDFYVEERVAFPGIKNVFGTCDLAARTGRRVTIADWKFGTGVPVPIASDDGRINAQLLFYASAFRHTFPDFFAGADEIELVILQPRINEEPVTVLVGLDDLNQFERDLRAAVDEALGAAPHRQRGPHCRFAACKVVCPEWTGPMLDLAKLQVPARTANNYGEILSAGLDLADLVEPMIRDLRSRAHDYLANGGQVPGRKLVHKRAVRRWIDETTAVIALQAAGFGPEEIFSGTTLLSPAQIETVAKATRRPFPSEFVVAASGGTTLAPATDARSGVPDSAAAVRRLSRALQQYQSAKRRK